MNLKYSTVIFVTFIQCIDIGLIRGIDTMRFKLKMLFPVMFMPKLSIGRKVDRNGEQHY